MPKKTIRDIDVGGKTCLLRVDFNVPVRPENGEILDDSRIRAVIPTVSYLRDQGAKVVLCSHFGRPNGQVVDELRLDAVRRRAQDWLLTDIVDAGGPVGRKTSRVISQLKPGDVAILENLRFHPGEESNDPAFADALARLADVYVNDAFGAAHRAHASIVGVAERLPAVAGYLMVQEINMLTAALEADQHPAISIIGGAKVADKIRVLSHLAKRSDTLMIGGGMVAAFLKARGDSGGAAVVTEDEVHAAGELLFAAGSELMIPVDVVVGDEFSADTTAREVSADAVPDDSLILDIGPDTRAVYGSELVRAKSIIWNGPMGVFEWEQFAGGTIAVARSIAAAPDALKVVGGGSTAAVINDLDLRDRVTHVSTGGGASLEFLEGKVLPGVAALDEAED